MKYIGACIVRALCRFLIFLGACGWLCMMLLRHTEEDDDAPDDGHNRKEFHMQAYILGLIRHAATVFGGYLAASADDINLLVGAAVALVGIVWSMVDKYIASQA